MQIEILRFVRSGRRMEKRLGGSELGVESWAYKNILAGKISYFLFNRPGFAKVETTIAKC
jgi:hypothetical protein